jgi:hypothetical protein
MDCGQSRARLPSLDGPTSLMLTILFVAKAAAFQQFTVFCTAEIQRFKARFPIDFAGGTVIINSPTYGVQRLSQRYI